MSAGASLYKGMFTGHVSRHLRQDSCPKTQNICALDCSSLPYVGLSTVAGNQLRPCGQRRPDSWVNLSLFLFLTWVQVRKARSSISPVTKHVGTVNLITEATLKVDLSQSLILTHSSSARQDGLLTQGLASAQLMCSGPFYLFQNQIKQAKKLLTGFCFWTYSKDRQTQEHLRQPH